MMMKMTTSKNAVLLGLLVLLVVSVECFIPRSHQQKATTTTTRKHQRQQPWMNKIALETRGGASLQDEDSDDSDSDDSSDSEDDEEDVAAAEAEEEETDDESDDETDPSSIPLPAVNTAATVVFRTNIGSNLVDISSMELLVSRSRTVESVKQTLSRMLPGRPPVECLAIMADGMVLDDDEILLDSVLDDDDDDDEEDGEPTVLLLNMIPPVDPKFAAALGSTMQDMSTSELLDSYTANAAAMSASTTDDTTMISTRIRQDAHDMREQLLSDCGFSASVVESLSSEAAATESTARRGQRYRATGGGGARTNLKRIIQTNLNIVSCCIVLEMPLL